MKILPREFYLRHPEEVARELLGKYIFRKVSGTQIIAKIVETEAYGGKEDPASYAHLGIMPKSRLMFEEGGRAYITRHIYGRLGFNVTTGVEGEPGAVLIRACEPVKGINYMWNRRRVDNLREMTNGPSKLVQALNITPRLNGVDVTMPGPLFLGDFLAPIIPRLKRRKQEIPDFASGLHLGEPSKNPYENFRKEDVDDLLQFYLSRYPGDMESLLEEVGIYPEIVQEGRIGVRSGRMLPWRFYFKDNEFVSHRK